MPRILAALLVLLLATSAHAGTIWQMPTEYPATTLVGEGLALFAKLTAGKTNGEIAITPRYEAGQAFKSSGMIAAIQEGRTPAGDAFLSALTATDPLFALPALPFLATSFDDAQRLADLARPAYAKAMAKHGLRLLYLTPWPATGLWTKTRVTTPEQLRALSVRAYDATSTEVMTNAGVKATNLSFADTMPRLKDGSIDAVLSSGDGGAGRGLYQFLPNFLAINYALPLSAALIDERIFAAAPLAQQTAILNAAEETERQLWQTVRSRLKENYAQMRGHGVAIDTEVPAELVAHLAKAGSGALDKWLATAGPEAAEIVRRYRGK